MVKTKFWGGNPTCGPSGLRACWACKENYEYGKPPREFGQPEYDDDMEKAETIKQASKDISEAINYAATPDFWVRALEKSWKREPGQSNAQFEEQQNIAYRICKLTDTHTLNEVMVRMWHIQGVFEANKFRKFFKHGV